jgi:hypothetical protein
MIRELALRSFQGTYDASSVSNRCMNRCSISIRLVGGLIMVVSLWTLVVASVKPAAAQSGEQTKASGAEPLPEPAIQGILAAFDRYEVVAMPEAHDQKDLNDFILSLIRTPGFAEKVNDIEVECGNSLYQATLDRYIAGQDVPFTEARKVWRNTTQPMCGMSGFFEQFFPLVRVINQKLPPAKRLRVLAGDPPIDWQQVKSAENVRKFGSRTPTIASVMEKEVLARHHRALMLFGTFHLFHTSAGSAVAAYEKDYPNATFVISDLDSFDMELPASWQIPSLVPAKGTWIGTLDLGHFYPPPISMDSECRVHNEFSKELQKPMAELVDAFLYLHPERLALKEQIPADIVLDSKYWNELKRRETLQGFFGASAEQIVSDAENPILEFPTAEETKALMQGPLVQQDVQECLAKKGQGKAPH